VGAPSIETTPLVSAAKPSTGSSALAVGFAITGLAE
jgi:hypothetical protein